MLVTIVNALAILVGGMVGVLFKNVISEKIAEVPCFPQYVPNIYFLFV